MKRLSIMNLKCIPAFLVRGKIPKSDEDINEIVGRVRDAGLVVPPENIRGILEECGVYDLEDLSDRKLLTPAEALVRLFAAAKCAMMGGMLVAAEIKEAEARKLT